MVPACIAEVGLGSFIATPKPVSFNGAELSLLEIFFISTIYIEQ